MPTVNIIPNGMHLIIQVISLVILYFLFRRFLWAPMKKFLEKRQAFIAEEFNQAQATKEEANELNQQAQMQIKKAGDEAQEIIENSQERAKTMYDQMIAAAQEETDKKMLQAQAAIEQERATAYTELKKDMAQMTITLTENLIKKEIDEKVHQDLFDDFIAKVGGSDE